MSISKDLEVGQGLQSDLKQPLISKGKEVILSTDSSSNGKDGGSIWMVLLSTFVAVAGSFEFGCAVGFSSPTQSSIRHELGLTLAEYSVFGSILTIGSMVGAVMSGRVADSIGRKGAMRISGGFCMIGWLAIYYSKAAWSLDIGRLSVGYGIGMLSYVVPVYIAEITPKNLRGGLTTVNQLMICSGASTAFILGTILTWRVLALIGVLPCLILLFGLSLVPESPRWLAKVGSHNEFEVALQTLRGKGADISEEAAEIQDYITIIEGLPQGKLQDLFQRKYTHPLIVGVGLIALQQFGGINGIAFYASETFVSAGFSSGAVGTIAMASIQVPLTGLVTLLMDKFGRRPLLMISASGTCLGSLLAALSFVLQDQDNTFEFAPILALTGLLVYIAAFSLGMGAIPWVMMAEVFPLNVKGTAGSLVSLVHWFGSWIMSYSYNFFMSWSKAGTFFMFSGVCGVTVLFVAKLVPETKGRTLEEIQASMEHSSHSSAKLGMQK